MINQALSNLQEAQTALRQLSYLTPSEIAEARNVMKAIEGLRKLKRDHAHCGADLSNEIDQLYLSVPPDFPENYQALKEAHDSLRTVCSLLEIYL